MAGINDIAKAAGLKDTDVQMVFAQILELVKQDETNPDGTIKGPKRVQINGFGSFTRSTLKERIIHSPVLQGGQALVAARDVLRFKPSPHTKAYLNGEVEAAAVTEGAEEPAVEAEGAEGEVEAEVEETPPPPPPKPVAKPAVAKPAPVAKPAAPAAKPAAAAPAAKPTVAKPAPAAAKPAAPAVAKPANGVKPAAPAAAKPAVAKPAPKPAPPPPPPPAEEEAGDDENPGEFTGDD